MTLMSLGLVRGLIGQLLGTLLGMALAMIVRLLLGDSAWSTEPVLVTGFVFGVVRLLARCRRLDRLAEVDASARRRRCTMARRSGSRRGHAILAWTTITR